MDHADALEVLAVAAAFDRRTVGEADGMAWSLALPDIKTQAAKDAVITHYRHSTAWIMPAHVIELVHQTRTDRIRAVGPVIPPRELADDYRGEIAWRSRHREAVADGASPTEARSLANEALGISENAEPLAIEASAHDLRESLDRTAREMADKERMAQIQAEVERQAKERHRAEQLEAEKTRKPVESKEDA